MAEPTPPTDNQPDMVHGWIREAIEEGDAFLKQQPGFSKIDETMRAIFSPQKEFRSPHLSSTEDNRLAKVATDMAAHLTDIKPFWEYRTKNKKYERHQKIYGDLAYHWYTQRFIDLNLNEAVKYYLMAGASYTHLTWDTETRDLAVSAEDPRDVLPIRPSNYLSIQSSLGVVLRRERSVNYLRMRHPESKWNLIKADRDGSVRAEHGDTRFGRILNSMGVPSDSPFLRRLFGKPHRGMPKIPMADEFTVYLKDASRNESSHPVMMGSFDEQGRALNNWSYIVPPKGKLYPRGRCVVATSGGILHDGPNPYWHGLFPIPKLNLDHWPQSWFGKAPLWDLLSMQKSLDRTHRVVDDFLEKVARPDVIADKNSVPKSVLERWDTRRAGGKYQHNPIAGKGMELVYPQSLPAEVRWRIEDLRNEMDTLSGNRDLSQLMQLNQVPAADTIEKITESMTASVQGRSRALEAYMREFATMVAYNFAQFYTIKRRLTILGPDGITEEDFDFDPGTLIPDYIHDDDFDDRGVITTEAMSRGPMPRLDRTEEFMRQFSFHVAPGSLLSASEIQRKLLYLQLARAGIVDHWTLLEILGVPNVGEPPSGAITITDRLMAEQEMGLGMQVNPVGRKASGKTMPRQTIKES